MKRERSPLLVVSPSRSGPSNNAPNATPRTLQLGEDPELGDPCAGGAHSMLRARCRICTACLACTGRGRDWRGILETGC